MRIADSISRRELLVSATAAAAGWSLASAADPLIERTDHPVGKAAKSMRLGLVTYNVAKDWPLDVLLRNVREADLKGIEFRTTHAHGVEPTLNAAQRADVKKRCLDAGIAQLSLGTVCEFQDTNPAVVRKNIETCREFVLLAREIGARGVKVRPNGLPESVPVEQTLKQIGKALAECGEFGKENGVEIWMEVHGAGTMLPENARKIMDFCRHKNVGVTWNSNATDVKNGSVGEAYKLLGPFIRCCHITEMWNDYPYRELFSLLAKSKFDGFTLCEIGASIKEEDGIPFLRCYRGLWKELCR